MRLSPDIVRDPRAYHPHRKDGLDGNLTRLNDADYRAGRRCTCDVCLRQYEDARAYLRFLMASKGGQQ